MEEEEWDDELLLEIEALEASHLHTNRHQVQAQIQPTAVPTTNDSAGWRCKSCTLQNEASKLVCQVCGTRQGQINQAPPAFTAVKKTVQARLAFDGTSVSLSQQRHVEQDLVRSTSRPFPAIQSDRKSIKTTLSSDATQSKLMSTSNCAGASITNTLAAVPQPIVRLAAGEDALAKTRYLDIVTRSSFPPIDYEAAQHFVYPTNYSIRDYQVTIAEKALYHNTLVSLPTGLGKTLVAAVVMYNFYRWFPTGKIVFMAPTKPLVAQQIKACHEIMGIPLSDTAELQGTVPPTVRRVLWSTRRVFFCTPQSLQNDLRQEICPADQFVCLVVDEAHRATGNYAYCCVVQEIAAKTPFFRVLALSATPGAKFNVIQDVVTNLRISHIESRSADDVDVKQYTHARQEEVIVCRLGVQMMEIKRQFLKLLMPLTRRLLRNQIIQKSDPDTLTSWYVLQAREKFRQRADYASNRSAESDLALLVSLLHAKTLLTGHGLNSFRDQIIHWVEERNKGKLSWSKREMVQSLEFQKLEASLAVTGNSSSRTASHPKLVKLREVLLEHFQRHAAGASSTRAIVFTQYRASVSEIVALLHPLAPLLKVQPFIGQGASGKAKENKGQSQKVQQEIVQKFRVGDFNVLVATCIAEEGLDIGEVDLIVSFDALTSPVRMIQRMGRTGRKRVGKVIILVTEGEEQKKLALSASAAKTVSRALTTFKSKFAYANCPRMLPTGINPHLRALDMKIPTFHASQVGGKVSATALDPELWQLSDAERAVAMLKYFPPNFAASSRNKLFPIVGNQLHLLRRQPRSLVRNSLSNRVGYSARSLILQALVRKVHGVDEILETDSNDEDGASIVVEDQSEPTHFGDSTTCGFFPLDCTYECCRIKASADSVETDGEISSRVRKSSVLDGADDSGEISCAARDDSMAFCDMHFSPQFVDLASQVVPTIVKDKQRNDYNVICIGKPVATSTTKKHEPDSCTKEDTRAVHLSTASISPSEDKTGEQVTEVVSGTSVGRLVDFKHAGSQEASLTRKSISSCLSFRASKSVYTQEIGEGTDFAHELAGASRHRSTRQLTFDEEEGDECPSNQSPTAELSSLKLARETRGEFEKNEVSGVETEDSYALFASLPPATHAMNTGNATKEPVLYKEMTKKAPSFPAVLPSLSNGADGTLNRPSGLLSTACMDKRSTPGEDVTDRDEGDETSEVNSADMNQLVRSPGLDRSTLDRLEQRNDDTNVNRTRIAKLRDMTLLSKRHLSGPAYVARQTKQSKRNEADPGLSEDSCCSICLSSESYDDDPIVFCDGCDVAVHQFCYGIYLVPSDKWFCAVCTEAQSEDSTAAFRPPRCQLCPHRGGAFKRTACRQWVHVQCFLWIPEFCVEQNKNDLLVLGDLSRLDPDRKTLDCSLCHSQKGYGIIQCAQNRCLTAFHVSCAAYAHYRMDQVDSPGGTLFLAYCPRHCTSTAPRCHPQPPTLPVTAKRRRGDPTLPTPLAKTTSPSHLLASPSSAEAKQKFKTFRRLKRKYDASQSQTPSKPGAQESPVVTTPSWQKRMRRSKRRRETSRVLAAAYIDDIAEVQGGEHENDVDDEDEDENREAADDSFINDSSQLLYSQSIESFEEIGNKSIKKKTSSPDMRAIYAQSLFESQRSPLLHRRGGRHFRALPSNGIIRACLDEMRVCRPTALSTMERAPVTLIKSFEDDSATEAKPLPNFDVLKTAKSLQSVEQVDGVDEANKADSKVALLEAGTSLPSLSNAALTTPARPGRLKSMLNERVASVDQQLRQTEDSSDELLKKIEANRLEALRKLKERRQAKLSQGKRQPFQLHNEVLPSCASQSADVSAAQVIHGKEADAASCMISSPVGHSRGLCSPSQRSMTPTVDITSTPPNCTELPKWIIYVSSAIASSNVFSDVQSAKKAECTIVVAEAIEADMLLSVRTAVVFLTVQQLHELALASSVQSAAKNHRVEMLLAMHKKVIVAVVKNGKVPDLQRFRRLSNAQVIIQSSLDALCVQLHQMAHQERLEGYELPCPSLCRPDFSGVGARALDVEFASRLTFFRAMSHLSLDSAISLSFRFQNFSAMQVPVLKFNEMHWRRMLPWISKTTAEEIRNHVQQSVQH